MNSRKTVDSTVVRRKNKIIPRLAISIAVLAVFCCSVFIFSRVIFNNLSENPSISQLNAMWNNGDYSSLYEQSGYILQKNMVSNIALAYRGYSGLYLAVAQTDSILAQKYVDESINTLRIAMQSATKKSLAQIYYMLGKAYFYKNSLSSYHYYADLAVKYLLLAQELGFTADDIPEYLGLSYASLSMISESIASFTEALLVRESDVLLLAIAEQYYKNGVNAAAKPYLSRLNELSTDEVVLLQSHALLGKIYTDEKKYDVAKKEFQSILEKDPKFADAYYGLGVIYEAQGDLVKARAEWRKALRVQVNHSGALKKMGLL